MKTRAVLYPSKDVILVDGRATPRSFVEQLSWAPKLKWDVAYVKLRGTVVKVIREDYK